MHKLCLITCKVRSENGYGFLRPGLKTGVGNGIFGLKFGLDLEMRAAHTHQKFQGVPLPPGLYIHVYFQDDEKLRKANML